MMAGTNNNFGDNDRFVVVSYNMHGYNQGVEGTKEIIHKLYPDVIALQEHWLTPANLHTLNEVSSNYFCFGSSSMTSVLASGPLIGRPFGGTALLINNRLAKHTVNLVSNDRFTAVLLADCIVVSAYMPCSGTKDRVNLYSDILNELQVILENHIQYKLILCADLNTEIDVPSSISNLAKNFIHVNRLQRNDLLHPIANKYTFVNESQHVASCIDYIISSTDLLSVAYNVLDLDINMSDHLPIMCVFSCKITGSGYDANLHKPKLRSDVVSYFHWDHALLCQYYEQTRVLLEPIFAELVALDHFIVDLKTSVLHDKLETIYNSVVMALTTSADTCIPKIRKNFYKFWWSQELNELKAAAVTSARAWQQAGKPKYGLIFQNYYKDKLAYKKRIREDRQQETLSFTNSLHDALLRKNGKEFWKCWRAKTGTKNKCINQVDGTADSATIAGNFAKHFEQICQPHTISLNNKMKVKYEEMRSSYFTPKIEKSMEFDIQLIDSAVSDMSNGKAAGLDGLTAEHLKYSHPIVISILCKLFNFFIHTGFLPSNFGTSYTVPIPKQDGRLYGLSVNDFRGISISPVISKIFENAILVRFADYFTTSDYQFGFKKNHSCSHAIYCVRSVAEHYINNGSTVNICTVDLSKAFDRMNHFVLFIKLMERRFPIQLLNLFVLWFRISETCVRWGSYDSHFFKLTAGVRQGGVLSPYFFAIFVDDIVHKIIDCNVGCYFRNMCVSIFLYADDIILLCPSVNGLQRLLRVCERAIEDIDMKINASKTVCMRIGPRSDATCASLTLCNGTQLKWVDTCKYLGVHFLRGRNFRCTFEDVKKKFFSSFNAVYSKIGRFASEEVVLNLLNTKCIPTMLYGTEACPVMSRHKHSFDFTVTRVFMKILHTNSKSVVEECMKYFGFVPVSQRIDNRTARFLDRFISSDNMLCTLFKEEAQRYKNIL